MKRSNRLILLIGFFLAAVAFVGIVLLLGSGGGGGGTEPDATKTTIVVTTADIPLGTTLTDRPRHHAGGQDRARSPLARSRSRARSIGRTVTTQLTKGQLVNANAFSTTTVNPDIARLLDPGRRAMSIQVDQVSGVGTLIKPGDRVDVVVGIAGADKFPVVTTDPADGPDHPRAGPQRDVGQGDHPEPGGRGHAPPADAGPGRGRRRPDGQAPALNGQAQIVILAVTAQQAEVLRFGQMDGTLTLVLRSPEDKEAPSDETTGITLRKLVDRWAVIPPQIVETVLPTQKP